MIKAEHKRWARILYDLYIKRILKKSFSHFYLSNKLPNIPYDKALIITPNHISWWDGFFIDYVTKNTLNRKIHLMMLESSLNKFWFFKKVGAYSIDPENPISIIETFNYSRDILEEKKNFVVSYPQGEIESFEKRPLSLKYGIKSLIRPIKSNVIVLPVGFKIEYYEERLPAVICRFGSLLNGEKLVDNISIYEEEFMKNLDSLSESSFNKKFIRDLF
jgi:1-acyl-sn-glycerol-3-phosphate acyltransferase